MSIEQLKDDILEVAVEGDRPALWGMVTLARYFLPLMQESGQLAGLRVAIRDLLASGFIRLARFSSYDDWTILSEEEANAALEDGSNWVQSSEFPRISIIPTASGEESYVSKSR